MKFMLDENLPPALARALHELAKPSNEVMHLTQKFDRGIEDKQWMAALASEGDWAVITFDTSMRVDPHVLRAWSESGLSVFFLRRGWREIDIWQKASRLVKLWPQITSFALGTRSGVCYLVPVSGEKFNILRP